MRLNNAPHVTSLILRRNNIDNEGAFELGKLQHVTELFLSNNNIDDPQAVKALVGNKTIRSLYLDKNALEDNVAEIICDHAQQTTLNVDDNDDLSLNSKSKIARKIMQNKIQSQEGEKQKNRTGKKFF